MGLTKNNKTKNNKIKHNKGEISVTMLIFIALGIVVLVIFIAILSGKVKFFGNNTPDNCNSPSSCVQEADWGYVRDSVGNAVRADPKCQKDNAIKFQTSSCPSPSELKTQMGVCCKVLG